MNKFWMTADGKFTEVTAEQKAKLSAEELGAYTTDKNEASMAALKAELVEAQKDYIKDVLTKEQFAEKMETIQASIKEVAVPSNEETTKLLANIESLTKSVKTIGGEVKALKENGILNNDMSVNKNTLRSIVEKHFKEANCFGEEVEEKGIKVIPVSIKSAQKMSDSQVEQNFDGRNLSAKHVAKAGEAMYVNTPGANQTVFNQAVNRTYIGEISDPLTANEHAIDIFNTKTVTGSLMTLMVYQNLEANGELVAEGVAPSLDSRIELTSKDFKVFDFSATATVSKDQLRDSKEVIDELVRQLASNIKTVLDNILFTTGGDNVSAPYGVLNSSQSCELFNPLLFTGTSPSANMISLFGKAKLQARLNDWSTNASILHPNQWDELEDLKDTDTNSIKDNRLAVGALGEIIAVKGLRKYQTTKMPKNTMLVYNDVLQMIGLRQGVETQFGYNGTDLKDRKLSFVMDMRGAYGQLAIKSSIYINDITGAIAILKENAATSITRINAYAEASDATALTIATLTNTAATDIVDANLAAYQVAIAAEATIADLAALQAVIDTVNAA